MKFKGEALALAFVIMCLALCAYAMAVGNSGLCDHCG